MKLYQKLAADYADTQREYSDAAAGFEAGFLRAREMAADLVTECTNDYEISSQVESLAEKEVDE